MSARLFQLLFAACMLVSVAHGAGRGLTQVGSALGSGWPFGAFRPVAAVPQPKAVKLPVGTALKQVSDPGTSTDPLRQAACGSDTYRAPSGDCVCNPGFGHRYSAEYCSKCPKGATQCDDDMFTHHATR